MLFENQYPKVAASSGDSQNSSQITYNEAFRIFFLAAIFVKENWEFYNAQFFSVVWILSGLYVFSDKFWEL